MITDHYPSDKEYRAALDALSSVAAKHNVNIRPLFSTCKDWEEYFPLVAAFKQIQQEGFESVAANVNQTNGLMSLRRVNVPKVGNLRISLTLLAVVPC